MDHTSLAALSNDLFFAAVLCYAFAMLGYAAEFAFSSRAISAVQGAASQPRRVVLSEPSRVLVGAGGPQVGTSTADPAGGGPVDEDVIDLRDDSLDSLAGIPRDRGRAARREALREASGRGRGSLFGRAALLVTLAGWALHIGSVTTRGLSENRVPWGNMYEFSSMISLIAVTVFLLLLTKYPIRHLGAFLLVPIVLYMGLAGTVLYAPAGPLVPALNSYWLKIHVVAAMGSSAIFMVGGVVTVLYLIRQRWDRLTAAGRPATWAGIGRALPAAAGLDTLAYRIIAFAFPIWTFAIIAGAIWAEAAWGRYWGWDPKETWSFITWLVYAGYLHARATGGWRGRRAAMIALVGFGCLAVDYYVVNIWITGLHSYAGLG